MTPEIRDMSRARAAKPEVRHTPLVRALGLAHHWQRLLQSGRYDSLSDIAAAEGMDLGQASRILRLTQLAPEVIEAAIAQGQFKVGLSEVLKGFPND